MWLKGVSFICSHTSDALFYALLQHIQHQHYWGVVCPHNVSFKHDVSYLVKATSFKGKCHECDTEKAFTQARRMTMRDVASLQRSAPKWLINHAPTSMLGGNTKHTKSQLPQPPVIFVPAPLLHVLRCNPRLCRHALER